ncbi:hypothetical protein DPMN_164415 [Dreissena polymorpha]|uniref:Uncharacterized protein n=1 Tax=Dreissena polymorpha TaxID=45954 RepID=A0A9D4ESX0_DREPO|nr:hypothetical protein DPMN_164415 [Dreissena polymorpha]
MKSTKELPRYGSGHKSAGRTDIRTAGRTDNAKTISLRLWRGIMKYTVNIISSGVSQPTQNKHNPRSRHGQNFSALRPGRVFTQRIAEARGIDPRNEAESLENFNIIKTNILTKFHENWTINATIRVGHVFQPTGTIFELVQDIMGTHLLSKKNSPPIDIIGTNILTKFHDDRTINVASRVVFLGPIL